MHSYVSPAKRRLTATVGAITLALLAATVYGATVNIQIDDRTGYAKGSTDEGAIVEYIGDLNQSFGSSGSGIFDSFVRIQANDDEKGYNTDGDLEFDTKSGAFTHSILVSEIPVVECKSLDGLLDPAGLCWELFADLNESDSTKLISLDAFEIYLTSEGTDVNDDGDGPDLTGYPFSGNTTKVFDSDDQVLINDVNQGSGRGDLRYQVPISGISIPADCDYGSSSCETYFVLYSEYGFTDDEYDSDGGFEEWKVKRYPFLEVSKTATTTFTRTFPWTIDKSVTPASWALFDGDSGTSDYTVALTKGTGVDSAWAVSGTITIENTSDQDAPISGVTDTLTGGLSATVVCPVTFPYTLPDGDTLTCTYSRSLPDGTSRTNTASASLSTGAVFTGTAAVTFGMPTTLVNDTVHVDDTFAGGPQDMAFSASGQTTYSRTFDCGADEGTHNNTATITETGQSDSAAVTVTCYDLDVTKTAVESFNRDFDWTIEKSVDPTSLDLFNGDSDDVTWTVEWTKGAAEDFGYAVTGSITVDNNHPSLGAVINSVTDVISPAIAASVDCGVGVTFPHTIAAGGSLVCSYSSSLPDGTTRTNTATAVQQNHDYASDLTATASGTTDYTGTASVDFTGVTPTVTDDTATLSDARPGNTIDGDNVSASGSASWDETFTCSEDEGDHTNTATVTEDDSSDSDSDDATTTVNCYGLTVSKTATTTFTRDYDWDVEKSRVILEGEELDPADGLPETLVLDEGQTYLANYEIVVTMTGSTDSAWAVSGVITINNATPLNATGVSVSDVISPDSPTVEIDCDPALGDQNDTSVDILAGGNATCDYWASLADASNRTNIATATLFGVDYDSAAVNVTFDDTPDVQIDECVDVVDNGGTPADTSDDESFQVCLDDLEAGVYTHSYDILIGPYAVCGPYQFVNRVDLTTSDDDNDTNEAHFDVYTVNVEVPCPEGCTLTPGYWKTHNDSFWGGAPTDETWFLLEYWVYDAGTDSWSLAGPGDEDSPFFLSGQSYFDVLWAKKAGNVYYNLAFHYIAAQLNMLDGADPTAAQAAFDAATELFKEYTPDEVALLKGKNGKEVRAEFVELAGILASYNEGWIGPGHCDEDLTSAAVVLPPLLPLKRRWAN